MLSSMSDFSSPATQWIDNISFSRIPIWMIQVPVEGEFKTLQLFSMENFPVLFTSTPNMDLKLILL